MIEMRKAKLISLLIVLSMFVIPIPRVQAATDEWTVSTVDEDLFYATYKFEGVDMMYLQGEDMQIRSWFWFEGPVLDARRYIIEAYLEVTTPSIGATDPDAYMFIYGIPAQQGGTPSHAEDPSFINGPYTTILYQVNLSSFVGPGVKHNITVTSILREINQGYYFWDGHDIALATLSPAEQNEERYILTLEGGHPAKLYVHYGEPAYPPQIPPGGSVIEEYRNYTIWEFSPPDVNYTDMTQTGSAGKLHVFNETTFNFTDINKSTTNVALGYFVNETGPNTINGAIIEFNFTVDIDIHSAAQPSPAAFYLMGENDVIGSMSDVVGGNEIILFELYTQDINYYKFLPRNYGTGAGFGGYSGTLLKNTWYMGKITLDDTLWLFEISDMSGVAVTSCTHTLPFIYDIKAISPFACWEGVPGSQIDGWQKKEIAPSTFLLTGENGTIIQTWNGENFTDIDDLKDFVDTDVIGYPDPQDPDPPGWEDSPITAHRFKLILFVIGMALFIGTPVWGFATRPDAAAWIAIMMSMLCGVALLWSLQLM